MKRILFLILWIVPVFWSPAQGAIEIYVNGHKYDSLQEYLASKKSAVKASQVNQKNLSDASLHKLYVLGVEKGMVDALQDFYRTWGQYDIQLAHRISSGQLQKAIQQAVASSKYPKLLISGPGKVRIMAMSPDNSRKQVLLDY